MTKYHYYFLGVLVLISLVAAMFAQPSTKAKWSEQAKLVYENKWNRFGHAIAIDGDTVVVGTPSYNVCPGNECGRQGAANVYTRSGDTWVLQAQLLIPENLTGYQFGTSVAIDGDTIVVGSSLELLASHLWFAREKRASYRFVRNSRTGRWSRSVKMLPNNRDEILGNYGQRVAISGKRAVVSVDRLGRTVYIFEKDDSRD